MQVRGKKNIVISQDLTGPVGLFVKFSVLQQYGVDRVFLLENANVDSSQRNVVFLVRAEKIRQVRMVAGMSFLGFSRVFLPLSSYFCARSCRWDNSRLRRLLPPLRNQSSSLY